MNATLNLFAALVLSGTGAAVHAQTTFTKITQGAIVTDRGHFASAAWGDFSNRGLLDLLVCNYAAKNILYRNHGDGTFTKVTDEDPVRDAGHHVGPVVADYNNDGHLDLFVSAGIGAARPERNMLYKNLGAGTFIPVGGGGVSDATDARSLLFRNNGDGDFTRILTGSIVTDIIYNTSASWADYDNDGFMDLLINGAQTTRNFLYHNNRDGTFTRVSTNAVATDAWPSRGWGASWGDYDNDGLLDLFVPGMESGNRLYHNNGNGMFTNVAAGSMLLAPPGGGSRTSAWGDYDNDGYLDLFVASYNATNRLFRNTGDGTFTQVLSGHPVSDSGSRISSQTCGWADYDNDGFLDLFVTRMADNDVPTSNLLYRNNGNANAWLEVKLVGTVANRSAIGAKVRVRATIAGNTFWQMREITTGGGRWAQPLTAHFGLGDATNVETMRIEWPSGTVQELHNVPPKQILTVTEPPRLLITFTNSIPHFVLQGAHRFNCQHGGGFYLDVSTDLTNWTRSVGPFENLGGVWQIQDGLALWSGRGFYRARLSCAP